MRQQANANQILLQKALALHQKGQLAPAEELYKKVLVNLPRHFEANYLYGMLKLPQEDWETAEAQLAKPLPSIMFLRLMGRPQEDAGIFLEWADKIVHGVPGDPEASQQVREECGMALYGYFAENGRSSA